MDRGIMQFTKEQIRAATVFKRVWYKTFKKEIRLLIKMVDWLSIKLNKYDSK